MTDNAPSTEPPTPGEFGDFDLHRKDIRVGAECLWARMREAPTLPRSEQLGGFHVISRYEDLKKALMNAAIFSSASGITIPDAKVRSRHIPAETDPPLHSEYRALMSRFLTNEKVKAMEPAVRALVMKLLDAIGERSHVDLVEVFARPLPVYVALQLLGLPMEDGPMLDQLVVDLHEEVATGIKTGASDKLSTYIEQVVLRREASASGPDEDLLSSVVRGSVAGRALTTAEKVSMVRLVIIGGFDSTAIALATSAWWLAEHPEDAQRLRENPGLIDRASEEFVRFASPATYLRRTVAEDTQLGGTSLKKGDWVVFAFGAANRDPAAFDCPEKVVLDRAPNSHLGFGMGVHRCIGSFVAKLEMRIALAEILRRYQDIKVDASRPLKFSSGLNQGLISLPLALGTRTV